VIKTNNLFRGLPSFLCTVHGLLGDGTDWSYAEPIETDDLAWAVMESVLLAPPKPEDLFDPQIVAYCCVILKRDGLATPPSVLAFTKEDGIYGDLPGDIEIFGEDVLQEQADRTDDVNRYLEAQQQKLLEQIALIPHLGVEAAALNLAIQSELAGLVDADRWD
jgi:hypothetical protein